MIQHAKKKKNEKKKWKNKNFFLVNFVKNNSFKRILVFYVEKYKFDMWYPYIYIFFNIPYYIYIFYLFIYFNPLINLHYDNMIKFYYSYSFSSEIFLSHFSFIIIAIVQRRLQIISDTNHCWFSLIRWASKK